MAHHTNRRRGQNTEVNELQNRWYIPLPLFCKC